MPPVPAYRIRHAEPLDAAGYIALIRSILRETPRVDTPYAPDEFDPPVEAIRERIRTVTSSANSCFIVAEANRRIIGALTCGGGTLRADRHMTALGVYVLRDWRDQGVGTTLMDAAMTWALMQPEVRRVELEVMTTNARAIHLYEKFGFEREGIRRHLYLIDGQPVDIQMMARLFERERL